MAAKIITIAQQKGGAGKTSLAAHLAVAFAGLGKSVAAVDIDPQGSLSMWGKQREALELGGDKLSLHQISGWRVANEVEKLAKQNDIVIIDSPPHAETDAKIAVRAAKLVLVPLQPSPMDLWASQATLDMAKAEKRDVLMVLNRVPPRARLADTIEEEIGKLGVKVANARIGNRVALAESLLSGKGITEYRGSSVAAKEIKALADELLG